MAGTAFKSIDKERYKKIYPAKRFAPKWVKQSRKSLIIEAGKLEFTESSGVTSKTYTYKQLYASTPNITFGVNSTLGDMVLIKITAATNQTVTVEVSAAFDGSIDLQIMEIGE